MEVFLMNRRGTGVSFCFIAAFLFSVRYISSAIFGSGISSWDSELFNHMLTYVGNTLVVLSVISLGVGIIYLIKAEKEE
jgi:multisubunit Na+/H+ antiporter MnhB subunit